MSQSDGSTVVRSKKDESISIESSVEVVDTGNCSKRLCGLVLQVAASLFVLGCMAGALIWSFNNGEAGEAHQPTHNRDASVNFTIFVDEYSVKNGVYNVTRKAVDSSNKTSQITESYPTFWYQDNTNKRLVHRLDEIHTMYVRRDVSFYVTQKEIEGEPENCQIWQSNYDDYIEKLGLTNLTRRHSEIERKKNHKEVFIYEGDPSDVILVNTPAEAFLVTAYADAGNGALLGWDTYFKAINDKDLYMASYWYNSMTPSTPSDDVFEVPAICTPHMTDDEKKEKK